MFKNLVSKKLNTMVLKKIFFLSTVVFCQMTLNHVSICSVFPLSSTMRLVTKTVHLLQVTALFEILEVVVPHKSKGVPTTDLLQHYL